MSNPYQLFTHEFRIATDACGVLSEQTWARYSGFASEGIRMLNDREFRQARERHLAGDAAAWCSLGNDFLERARRICRPKWNGVQLSDRKDLVQEIVLAALRSVPTYDPAYRVGPWFRAIALNVSNSRYPAIKRWATRVALDEVAEPVDVLGEPQISENVGEQIRSILMQVMSQHQAFIVYWIGLLGMTRTEVATEFRTTPHTISQKWSEGIRKLRDAAQWHPVLRKLARDYAEASASTT